MEQCRQQNNASSPADMVIRLAGPQDTPELERLAQLDSAARPAGQVLVAEQGTVAVAAISLATGDVVADPFRRTAGVVSVLRLRRQHLVPGRRPKSMRHPILGRRNRGARAGLIGSNACVDR